jgi:hypothetical protein
VSHLPLVYHYLVVAVVAEEPYHEQSAVVSFHDEHLLLHHPVDVSLEQGPFHCRCYYYEPNDVNSPYSFEKLVSFRMCWVCRRRRCSGWTSWWKMWGVVADDDDNRRILGFGWMVN